MDSHPLTATLSLNLGCRPCSVISKLLRTTAHAVHVLGHVYSVTQASSTIVHLRLPSFWVILQPPADMSNSAKGTTIAEIDFETGALTRSMRQWSCRFDSPIWTEPHHIDFAIDSSPEWKSGARELQNERLQTISGADIRIYHYHAPEVKRPIPLRPFNDHKPSDQRRRSPSPRPRSRPF